MCKWNTIHTAAGKPLDISIAIVWRLEEQARDFVMTRDGLDQSIVGGAVELEAAIFHQSNI